MNNKKRGKLSKTILLISILIVLILVIVFGIFYIVPSIKSNYENVISSEATNMYTNHKIDTALKTKEKYGIIEENLKKYYQEFLDSTNDIKAIYSQNLINSCLSADNISSDGPEFKTTLDNIKKIKDIESQTNQKLDNLTSDDYIQGLANNLNLNDYYKELFISNIAENLKVKEDANSIKETMANYDNWLNSIETTLNMLTENKNNWKVNDGKIVFNSNELLNKYNDSITSIKSIETSLKESLNSLKI